MVYLRSQECVQNNSFLRNKAQMKDSAACPKFQVLKET